VLANNEATALTRLNQRTVNIYELILSNKNNDIDMKNKIKYVQK